MTGKLNPALAYILEHTLCRAVGRRYCGGSERMNELVEMGYMEDLGKPSWCPEHFYTITKEGEEAYRKYIQKNNRG